MSIPTVLSFLKLQEALRIASADDSTVKVEVHFECGPETPEPGSSWCAELTILTRDAQSGCSVGSAFVERGKGPAKADALQALYERVEPVLGDTPKPPVEVAPEENDFPWHPLSR